MYIITTAIEYWSSIHPNDTIGTGLSQGEIADRIINVLNDELAS